LVTAELHATPLHATAFTFTAILSTSMQSYVSCLIYNFSVFITNFNTYARKHAFHDQSMTQVSECYLLIKNAACNLFMSNSTPLSTMLYQASSSIHTPTSTFRATVNGSENAKPI